MRNFKEIFENYGADYNTTMTRFMGDEKMYMKFLDMFFKDENLLKMGQALEEGALTAAFEAAHTLKGVAANMGLSPLYQTVCDIVEPLRAGEPRQDYSMLYQRIQDEFHRVEVLRDELKGVV